MSHKTIQQIISSLVIAVAAFAFYVAAEAATETRTPIPAKERVADAAHVLSDKEKIQLTALSEKVEKNTGAVLVAVIIPKLEGETVEDYATRLHEAWKPGRDDDGRGAILVVSIADRKIRIAPTLAMGTTYTDSQAAAVIDNLKPYLKKMEYSNALFTFFTESAVFAGTAQAAVAPIVAPPVVEAGGMSMLVKILLSGLAILLIGFGVLSVYSDARARRRERKRKEEQLEREREREAALTRLVLAPKRPGFRKVLVDNQVRYERETPVNPFISNEQRQASRNESIRRSVEHERFMPKATAASATAATYETKRNQERAVEARKASERADEEASARRKRESNERENRRRNDDSYLSRSSYSSSSSDYSSSSSSFSSSSSSSSDGGGSTGSY